MKQKFNRIKYWLSENLKVIKYINSHKSKMTRWQLVLVSFFGSIVFINILGIVPQLHLIAINPQIVIFSQVVTIFVFIYRQLIWYLEICTIVEPLDIDFVHLGIRFTTYINIAKLSVGVGVTGAAVTVSGFGYFGHRINTLEASEKVKDGVIQNFQISDKVKDGVIQHFQISDKVKDTLIQSQADTIQSQADTIQDLIKNQEKKKPKGFF
jgi:hypothetical protein